MKGVRVAEGGSGVAARDALDQFEGAGVELERPARELLWELAAGDGEGHFGDDLIGELFGGGAVGFEGSDYRGGEPHGPELFRGDAVVHPGEHGGDSGELDQDSADVEQDYADLRILSCHLWVQGKEATLKPSTDFG